ncbi:MAG: metal-dependent transcriptional regulator [Eubacterium sp.]|nr:metal-dependent transcriptional regulator [Eubacterium sp.]MBR7072085.1 metal-dependent transcriptional regulator [Eubacterium sp.]
MDNRESAEMYLESIYVLSLKSDTVRRIDISKYMGYAKPSVTRGISLLEERGLVSVDESGNLLLTKEGKKEAQQIYERHTVLTNMFVKLGVDEKTAAQDACRIEHYISNKTFNAIKRHMKKYE